MRASLSLMGVGTSMAADSVKVVADKQARCSLSTVHRAPGHATVLHVRRVQPTVRRQLLRRLLWATHPWYRVKHHWVPLAERRPAGKWVGNIERTSSARWRARRPLAMAGRPDHAESIENTAETRLRRSPRPPWASTINRGRLEGRCWRMYTKKHAATLVDAWRRGGAAKYQAHDS